MIKEKSIFHGVPPRQVLPVGRVMHPLLSGPAWLVTLDDLHYRKVSQTLRTGHGGFFRTLPLNIGFFSLSSLMDV